MTFFGPRRIFTALTLILFCAAAFAQSTTDSVFEAPDTSAANAPMTPIAPPPNGLPTEKPTKNTGSLYQTAIALFFALAAIFAFFFLVKKFSPSQKNRIPNEVFQTVGEFPLTARVRLRAVLFGPKLLLLAISGEHAETLCEISSPEQIAAILEQCRPSQTTHSKRGS